MENFLLQTRPADASPGWRSGSLNWLFRKLIATQIRLTEKFDDFLPNQHRIDGNADFIDSLVPQYTPAGAVVYDVGGGRNPLIGVERKSQLGLKVIGLDIDAGELAAAPSGRYNRTICADIVSYRGAGDADLVICQALLEHVLDTGQALEAIASILKPGGQALLFVPSRNAVYARINLLLPQSLKQRILFGIYPGMRRSQGFPAHYDRCTPAALEALALRSGLRTVERRVYFQSDYFRFCFPIHALWRLWGLLFRSLAGNQAAETFSVVLRKEKESAGQELMENRVVLFGMNSSFAVRQFLPEVLAAVQERGFHAVVAAPRAPESAAFQTSFPGVEFRHVPMKREISLLSDIRSLCSLWFLLRSIRPALTNMSTPKMGLIGGLAAWIVGVPHRIYTLRGLRYETAHAWKRKLLIGCEKIACLCAHRVICISRSVRQTAIREGIAPADKLVLLGERGSEGVTIEPQPEIRGRDLLHLRKQLRIPEEAAVIGFVGRLTRDKGVCELVQCCQILQREGRAVHLLLLGDFESGDPVDRETVEWISTNPAAHWLGFVPDPKPYYRLMSAFVFPTYREGLPKVLLEAAAASTPVVSTKVTGVVDIIQDGLTGILVPPGDAPALARAVEHLLDEPAAAARMARAAQHMIREHFDNSFYLARLGEMIESLAAADRPHAGRPALEEARRL